MTERGDFAHGNTHITDRHHYSPQLPPLLQYCTAAITAAWSHHHRKLWLETNLRQAGPFLHQLNCL